MRFSVSVRDFQYAMKMVKDLKLPSGPLADTTSSLIEVSPERLVITAYNGEALVRATINAVADFTGNVVVDASLLFSAVYSFQPLKGDVGTSDLVFSVVDKGKKLNLSTKTKYANGNEIPHKRTFPLFLNEGFPDFSSIDSIHFKFKMKAARLTRGIDGAAYSLSSDKNNVIFTGYLVALADGKLREAATNGVCLSEYVASVDYAGEPVSVVVPGSVALRVSRSFSDDEDLDIAITDKHFFARSENLLVGGPLIREEFPDYRPLIAEPKFSIEVDKQVLLDNIMSLAYEAQRVSDNRVSLSVDNGILSLKVGESENTEIKSSGAQDKISVDCNLPLLVSSIKAVYGSNIKIGFSGEETPIHFISTKEEEGATVSSILVPLRTEAA